MSTVTSIELRRRRAFRETWEKQQGCCRNCGCELGADAQLEGITFSSGTWIWAELHCPTCAGEQLVMEVDRELLLRAHEQELDELDAG